MALVKIKHLSLYDYEYELAQPIFIKGKSLYKRSGVVIKVTNENHQSLYADIAPLPFFHKETLSEVKKHFFEIKDKLIDTHWSLKLLLGSSHILQELINPIQMPSLYFGLEMTFLSFLMPRLDVFKKIKVNALLHGSDSKILDKAKTLLEYEAIKIKVANRSPGQMLALMDELCSILPNKQFRIDINRNWSLDQTRFFCDHFEENLCEYLEEPLSNPLDLLTLSNQFNHPIAFDESLLDIPLDFLLSVPTKSALIIKPSLIGSIQKINYFYGKARYHNLKFILTSCFESGLGHLMIAQLAHFLAIDDAIGLDTYSWIKEDILLKKLSLEKGILNLKDNHFLNPYLNSDTLRLLDAHV